MITSFCSIAAPILASLLCGLVGLHIILVICGISFILSALSGLTIEIPATHKKPKKINIAAFKTDLVEGIKIIKAHKMIMNIIGIGMIINFCLSPLFSVGLIFIIREILKGSELQYGLFSTILALAMVISPITLGHIAQKIKVGKLFVYVFALTAALIGLLASASSNLFIGLFTTNTVPFIVITFISFLIGMIVTLINITVGTLFGTVVPKEFMGRTGAVLNLGLTVAMPMGQMLSGIGLDLLPASYVVASTAGIMFLAILIYRKPLLEADNSTQEKVKDDIINENPISN
jgi:MFS family permease